MVSEESIRLRKVGPRQASVHDAMGIALGMSIINTGQGLKTEIT